MGLGKHCRNLEKKNDEAGNCNSSYLWVMQKIVRVDATWASAKRKNLFQRIRVKNLQPHYWKSLPKRPIML